MRVLGRLSCARPAVPTPPADSREQRPSLPPPPPLLRPSLSPRSIQTILLAFVVGTLFLKEDTGLQTGPDGQPDVAASLTSANNYLGCG